MDHPHGTRSCYRRGCHCTACRAANAAYQAHYAAQRAKHIPLPRSIVPVRLAQHVLKACRREWLSQYRLAKEIGMRDDSLRLHPGGITRSKLAKLAQRARYYEIVY